MIDSCTCGESSPGTVIVFQGVTEHHCSPPHPCWTKDGGVEEVVASIPGLEVFV